MNRFSDLLASLVVLFALVWLILPVVVMLARRGKKDGDS
jgi:hypothetical protein